MLGANREQKSEHVVSAVHAVLFAHLAEESSLEDVSVVFKFVGDRHAIHLK